MRSRGIDPFDKRAMGFSIALHIALLGAAWTSTLDRGERIEFITYQIELVSPPPAVQATEVRTPTEELVVERPEPEPAPPEPEVREVVPVERPRPEPEPPPAPPRPERRPDPVERPPEPAEQVTVAAAPAEVPEVKPAESGEGLNVRMEGRRRDYPAYYDNILRQIFRCLRWRDGGNWQTTVRFSILSDGTVTDTQFERRSGNSAFDFEAMGAIDCAGRGSFGPLPADFPYERFPIRFEFRPSGDALGPFPTVGAPTVPVSER
jgi:outer membrane biosynthesis protein TonB